MGFDSRPISVVLAGLATSCLVSCDQTSVARPASNSKTSSSVVVSATDAASNDSTVDYCGDPTSDTRLRTAATASRDYTVTLSKLAETVAANELFSFVVAVEAVPGVATEHLNILVDAGMPQHAHGMTVRPKAHRIDADGRFEVDGMLFHMPGSWELHVDVVDGPYTERVTFYVDAR